MLGTVGEGNGCMPRPAAALVKGPARSLASSAGRVVARTRLRTDCRGWICPDVRLAGEAGTYRNWSYRLEFFVAEPASPGLVASGKNSSP